MTQENKVVHYYHADANALGGYLHRPITQPIDVQSPVSLSPVGGVSHVRNGRFQLLSIVTADATESQVSGSPNRLTGCPETMAVSKVEGLNVLHMVSADLVVGQILSSHPKDGGAARVTFAGTQFQGLKVTGHEVKVKLDLDIFDHVKHIQKRGFPSEPAIRHSKFLNKVPRKSRNEDCIRTSLVTEISGYPGGISDNALDVPGLGTVYLAELLVSPVSYRLIMMRIELGCPTQGSMTAAAVKVNGGGH